MVIDISNKVKTLTSELERSLRSLSADALETASLPLNDLRDDVREVLQEALREPSKELLRKLKRDEPLSIDDREMIEKWIVGDAEYYAKTENNFNDWVEECKRLRMELDLYANPKVETDPVKLLTLSALLEDLKFTLNDVIRYVEARDRVNRFKTSISTGSIDRETKRGIAEMIEAKSASRDF